MSGVHTRRLTAQLLAGRTARDPVAVCERLLAVQGQDPRGARLAIRARTHGVSAADVDRALTEDRSLLITWCNRGTLHLVRSEDYPWLALLTTSQLRTSNATRLAQEEFTPAEIERGLGVIERSLVSEGPLTRAQLGHALQRADVPIAGQAIIHLLFRAAIDGLIVRGPMIGRQHAYVLVRDWLPAPGPIDGDVALAELARRYLAGHGPASDRDLARWAGVPLRDARAGLSAIARELVQRPDGLVELACDVRRAARFPAPRLLGAFEPVLLGWQSREAVLGEHAATVVSGGIFRGFAMVQGRAVAVWAIRNGRVVIEPCLPVLDEVAGALESDADAVLTFLGLGQAPASEG
ncbi:MAG: winged helix DNA-binding domain-containing protein [Solirubrobacteraceae bacterium]